MNAGMTIATIFSLLLALATAGDAARYQAGVNDSPAVRGSNLNHNETLVRDTTGSIKLKATKIGAGVCPKWVCGANPNETLVRDTAPMK
ncbi:MAG: hypothetical protein H0U18_01920 [Pyrinomonadaceae bacterium]|nr:hypothetical protein [Pyrinomonadaceae bacterium]